MPEGIYTPDDLDSVFSLFGSAGIEVIDSEQDFEDEGVRDNRRGENNGKSRNVDFRSLARDKVVDPARFYFREMATVPLLNLRKLRHSSRSHMLTAFLEGSLGPE